MRMRKREGEKATKQNQNDFRDMRIPTRIVMTGGLLLRSLTQIK